MTFLQFWAAANAILKSHGKAELLYGDANGYWREFNG